MTNVLPFCLSTRESTLITSSPAKLQWLVAAVSWLSDFTSLVFLYWKQGSAHSLDLITSFIELREEPDGWRSGWNGRHRLIDLIVQFLVGGTVLGGNRRCDLVGGGVLLQVGLEISKAMPGTDCLCLYHFLPPSLCPPPIPIPLPASNFWIKYTLSATAPVPCLPACCCAPCHDWSWSHTLNCKQVSNEVLFE